MVCRRCQSADLLALEVFKPGDNPVYRCRPCGFLFSPGSDAVAAAPQSAGAQSAAPCRPIAGRRRRDS